VLLAEPRAAPPPPRRVWRDWLLVGIVVVAVPLELAINDEVVWPVVGVAMAAILVWALLHRRARPLASVMVVALPIIVTNVVSALTDAGPSGLFVLAQLLILSYALYRWGSGMEMAIGMVALLGLLVTSLWIDPVPVGEIIAATVIFLFPVELGAIVRYWKTAHHKEMEEITLRERQRLARELHDTVAHHVSAIAVRAQAGRALAGGDPRAATAALEVIENEASLTLAEMRQMVGVLRMGDPVVLAPQPRLADLADLAGDNGDAPTVTVDVSGDVDGVSESLQTTIYRLAQESVTNALRHARGARTIAVSVAATPELVRLEVRDDGKSVTGDRSHPGYGLLGMAERAAILGGDLEAGPDPRGGWVVTASLPRDAP
jgi:signal transduction histidine kinase